MRKRKKRKRRIGSSLLLLLLLAIPFSSSIYADKKHAAKGDQGTYGVVGGTVFKESGYALAGAEVVIEPDPQPGQEPVKIKYRNAVSDNRGEFAFRVPTSAMRYTVKAKAKAYAPQQKSVDIEGEVRVDVTLTLPAVSK